MGGIYEDRLGNPACRRYSSAASRSPESEPLPELEPALPPRMVARRRIAARGGYARA